MDELSSTLNNLLKDPAAMSQIRSLAQSLGLNPSEGTALPASGASEPSEGPTSSALPAVQEAKPGGLEGPSMKALLSAFQQTLPVAEDQRHKALLEALKAYSNDQRREKIDKAYQVARMVKLAKAARDSLLK